MIPDARALAEALPVMLGTWALLGLLCAGLGWLTARVVLGRRGWPAGGRSLPSWPLAAWLGLATLIGVLQLWQIVAPVQGPAVGAVAGLALAGLGLRWRERPRARTAADPKGSTGGSHHWAPWAWALFSLAVWMAAVRGLGAGLGYDSAHYHHALAQWFSGFRLPPGLANIHPYFGLNLSGLLLAALIDRGPAHGHSHQLMNGFIVLLFLALALDRIRIGGQTQNLGATRGTGSPGAPWLWVTLLFLPIAAIHYGRGSLVTTLSTDVLAVCAILAGWGLWLDRRSGLGSGPSGKSCRLLRLASVSMASLAITGKSTALVLGGLVIVAQLSFERDSWRSRGRMAAFVGFMLGPWVLRSVIATGYLLYPYPNFPVPVDWRVRHEIVDGFLWNITGWARSPGSFETMDQPYWSFKWLPIWWKHELRSALVEAWIPLALTAVLLGGAIRSRILRPAAQPQSRTRGGELLQFRAQAVSLAIAAIAWLLTAPSVRFGQFLFWGLASLVAAGSFWGPVLQRRLPLVAIGWALSPILVFGYYESRDGRGIDLRRFVDSLTAPRFEEGWSELPRAQLVSQTVCGNLEISVTGVALAADATNWAEAFLWAAAPPATSFPVLGACARSSGSIEGGFRAAPTHEFRELLGETLRTEAQRTGWSVGQIAYVYLIPPDEVRRALAAPGPTDRGAVP